MIKLVISQYFYDQLNIDLGRWALLDLDPRFLIELGEYWCLVVDVIESLLELNWEKRNMCEFIILHQKELAAHGCDKARNHKEKDMKSHKRKKYLQELITIVISWILCSHKCSHSA